MLGKVLGKIFGSSLEKVLIIVVRIFWVLFARVWVNEPRRRSCGCGS